MWVFWQFPRSILLLQFDPGNVWSARKQVKKMHGGGGGIRTHGGVSPTPVFKTGTFDRSVTPPAVVSF